MKEPKMIRIYSALDPQDFEDFIELVDWGDKSTGNVSEYIRTMIKKEIREHKKMKLKWEEETDNVNSR